MKKFIFAIAILSLSISLTACQNQSNAETKVPESSEPQEIKKLKFYFDDERMIDIDTAYADIDACDDITTLKENFKNMIDYANSTQEVANAYNGLISTYADWLDSDNTLFDKFLTIHQHHETYSEVLYQYKDLAKRMHEIADRQKNMD